MKYKIIANTSYKKEQGLKDILWFFIYYFDVPQPTLGYRRGDKITDSMLITTFTQISTGR